MTIPLLVVILMVILIYLLVTIFWTHMNSDSARRMLAARDQRWKAHISEHYQLREDSWLRKAAVATDPAFTDSDYLSTLQGDPWLQENGYMDTMHGDLIQNQGTPSPQPPEEQPVRLKAVRTPTDRWDGTAPRQSDLELVRKIANGLHEANPERPLKQCMDDAERQLDLLEKRLKTDKTGQALEAMTKDDLL